MKFVKPFITIGVLSAMLVGCGANDNQNDRFANDDNGPLNVNYDNTNNRDWVGSNRHLNSDRNMNDDNELTREDRANRNEGNIHNDTNRNDNRVDVADDVADQVGKMDEVENAYVLTTDQNAYIAVRLKNGDKLSKNLEDKIRDQAQKANKNFDKVYVSVNPDFYDRMKGYRDDIRNGNPVSGLFDEFSETVKRIFPNAQ